MIQSDILGSIIEIKKREHRFYLRNKTKDVGWPEQKWQFNNTR